jgi:Mg2+/Co2+ transporter CorB
MSIMHPVTSIFGVLSRETGRFLRRLRGAPSAPRDETAANHAGGEASSDDGTLAPREVETPTNILNLSELKVLDLMVHRTKMVTIDISEPPTKVIDTMLASPHSRMPVWQDQPENIVGVLHTKDLLAALRACGWSPARLDVTKLLDPPWFVPDTTGIKAQLNNFLKRKAQLALVVDEYGEVQGLVTLEDILGEIVGQIADEHDVGEIQIRPQLDGSVLVEGALPIRDLNRATGWSLPDEVATTVAGLVMHEAQTIPEAGQVFTFYGFRFEIVRKARNKITAVRVRPAVTAAAPAA